MYEKARDQARHMSALNCAEVSDKSMPGVQSGQRTPLSLSMAEELVNDKNELKSFFMNEVQLGKQLLAEGMHEEGLEHHSNAIVLCNEPAQALQFFRRILLPEQFELLIRALPAAKQRMGLKYPGLSSMLEAADKANAAGEGGARAAFEHEQIRITTSRRSELESSTRKILLRPVRCRKRLFKLSLTAISSESLKGFKVCCTIDGPRVAVAFTWSFSLRTNGVPARRQRVLSLRKLRRRSRDCYRH